MASRMGFDIISKIIFGTDLEEKVGLIPYTDPTTGITKDICVHDVKDNEMRERMNALTDIWKNLTPFFLYPFFYGQYEK